jgi:hypothetical protein
MMDARTELLRYSPVFALASVVPGGLYTEDLETNYYPLTALKCFDYDEKIRASALDLSIFQNPKANSTSTYFLTQHYAAELSVML